MRTNQCPPIGATNSPLTLPVRSLVHAVLAATLALGLAGCPTAPPGETPPFDTTGTYAGMFGTNDKQFGGAADCTLEMQLFQVVTLPAIAYTFAGVAELNWDCILPAVVRAQLGIDSDVLTLPVLARLEDNGSFSLDIELDGANIPPALQVLIDDSDVDTDIPLQRFAMTFTGAGQDMNDDGFMDACMGTLDVSFTYEDEESVTQMVDLGGTFDMMRTGR